MPRMTGKKALIEQLLTDGARYVFGNPGTTEQGFMDALQDYPQLEFILALHEGVAVGIADAYARATRRPAFVELHIAPGLGNAMGMLYDAARGHTPLVVYAGQSDTRTLVHEPLLSGDLVALAAPVCKWAAEARYAADVPQLLRRAMKVAAEPPQGPVFLSLPMDVLDQEAEVTLTPTSYTRWQSRPAADAVRQAAHLLTGARRPAVVVGDQIALSGAQTQVTALAELLGAPIFGGYASEINAPVTHPLWAGSLSVVDGAAVRAAIEDYDLLLVAGTPVFQTIFPSPAGPLPPGQTVIQVDADAHELAKNAPVELALLADPGATLGELVPAVADLLSPEQREDAQRRGTEVGERLRRQRQRERELDQRDRNRCPITPARLMEELAAVLPEGAAVFDESITSGAALQRYLRPSRPGSYFRARGGGLGPGMPGALGLQLAYPERPVVGVVADGSAMYTITALWTAAHHRLPVTYVICNNSSYRILKLNLLAYLGEAGGQRQLVATDLLDPRLEFDRLAEAMGVRGYRVEQPEELAGALREAIAFAGPSLVDVVLDPAIPGRSR